MGVSIGFIGATTEELNRAEKEPSWADEYHYELYGSDTFPLSDRPHSDPDKAFAGLQFLLDETPGGSTPRVNWPGSSAPMRNSSPSSRRRPTVDLGRS
ncbi:YfbM family protein [Streptomyces platensis]|uniref:DUF1877 family protein n=1 Tax=Streptomyces platensis TaxID=58346 RepID=UPI002ED1C344|nr:YfbM family protein [Streptomyces platensis]